MKKLLFCIAMLIYSYSATAQTDTIHLRGIIYNYDGKPAKNVSVTAKPHCLQCIGVRLNAITDSIGYFTLDGATPWDTITVRGGNAYHEDLMFENKGSRYVIIYLPKEYTEEIGERNPVVVSAKRRFPKITPSFAMNGANVDFTMVHINASFSGAFDNYLKQHLYYPQQAIDHNIEGTVQIGFDILKDGTLANYKILKGIDYGCDEELIALLKSSPHWRPAIIDGKLLIQHESVAVEFKLTDK